MFLVYIIVNVSSQITWPTLIEQIHVKQSNCNYLFGLWENQDMFDCVRLILIIFMLHHNVINLKHCWTFRLEWRIMKYKQFRTSNEIADGIYLEKFLRIFILVTLLSKFSIESFTLFQENEARDYYSVFHIGIFSL